MRCDKMNITIKTMRVITTICWVISGVALLGLVGWFAVSAAMGLLSDRWDSNWQLMLDVGDIASRSEPFSFTDLYSFEPEGLNSVSINWVAGEITIMPHSGDTIKITESAQRAIRDSETVYISSHGGTLSIRCREPGIVRNVRMNSMPVKRLEVLVPYAFSGDFEKLSVNSISGGVNIDGLAPATLEIITTSGRIDISNVVSRSLYANTISGAITIAHVHADDIELDSTSGAITVATSSAGELEIGSISGAISVSESSAGALGADATSGRINVSGAFDRARLGSLSGGISITSTVLPASLIVDSTSGSISVTVPGDSPVAVFHSSVSGRFSSEIPVILQGRDAQFEFSSISGNTRIFEIN